MGRRAQLLKGQVCKARCGGCKCASAGARSRKYGATDEPLSCCQHLWVHFCSWLAKAVPCCWWAVQFQLLKSAHRHFSAYWEAGADLQSLVWPLQNQQRCKSARVVANKRLLSDRFVPRSLMETVGCSQGRLALLLVVGSLLLCGTRCWLEGRAPSSQQNKGDLAHNLPWPRARDMWCMILWVCTHPPAMQPEFSSGSSMSCPAVKC